MNVKKLNSNFLSYRHTPLILNNLLFAKTRTMSFLSALSIEHFPIEHDHFLHILTAFSQCVCVMLSHKGPAVFFCCVLERHPFQTCTSKRDRVCALAHYSGMLMRLTLAESSCHNQLLSFNYAVNGTCLNGANFLPPLFSHHLVIYSKLL